MKFNDTEFKEPSSINFRPEKIWSSNTKRTSSGLMVGDVIAIKDTISLMWNILTPEELVTLDAIISNAFFNMTYLDPRTNATITKEFYASTPSYTVYSYVEGMYKYQGTAVDIIER